MKIFWRQIQIFAFGIRTVGTVNRTTWTIRNPNAFGIRVPTVVNNSGDPRIICVRYLNVWEIFTCNSALAFSSSSKSGSGSSPFDSLPPSPSDWHAKSVSEMSEADMPLALSLSNLSGFTLEDSISSEEDSIGDVIGDRGRRMGIWNLKNMIDCWRGKFMLTLESRCLPGSGRRCLVIANYSKGCCKLTEFTLGAIK